MDRQALIDIIARVGRKKPAEIADHMSLASVGISKSLGLSALRSHIEARSGTEVGAVSVDMTIAQLARLAAGGTVSPAKSVTASRQSTPPVSTAPAPTGPTPLGRIAIGLDLQDVAALPPTDDMRGHPFYSANFTPSELATAALRPDPRSHLCGIFCAKEAVKKSHAALIELRMAAMIVDHDPSGRPSLRFVDPDLQTRFSCSLSITHSAGFAAATCLTIAA